MKYAIFSIAALAIGASASQGPTLVRFANTPTLTKRDLATIQSVISTVGSGLATLNNSVVAWNGGDATQVESDGTSLNNAVTSGASTVQGTSALTLNDALSLQGLVGGLQTQGQTLVNNLAAKKTQFEAAGLCATIQKQSNDLNTNSKALIDAIVSKVPTEAQSIATNLAAGFTAVLAQNSANYAQGNCTNTGGGSGSSSSSSAGSASATSSAATGSSRPTATGATGATGATARPTTTGAGGSSPSTVVTAGVAATGVPIAAAFGLAALLL